MIIGVAIKHRTHARIYAINKKQCKSKLIHKTELFSEDLW